MQRTIHIENKESLTYLIGCLVHGKYTVKSYEHTYVLIDENPENRMKFNVRFTIPKERSLEEIFSAYT